MRGSQQDPEAWKQKVQEVSAAWKSIGPDEQQLFVAMAAEEQALKESAALEPFPSKAEISGTMHSNPGAATAAESLSRGALKTISKQRVMATYQRFLHASEWRDHDGGLCSAHGSLDLDLVNTDATQESIHAEWASFAKPHGELPSEWKKITEEWKLGFRDLDADAGCHHYQCHAEYGFCSSATCHMDTVNKYVYCMADLVNTGARASFLVLVFVNFFQACCRMWHVACNMCDSVPRQAETWEFGAVARSAL